MGSDGFGWVMLGGRRVPLRGLDRRVGCGLWRESGRLGVCVVEPGQGAGMRDPRVWGMALIRFVVCAGFCTLTSPWWVGGGWVHGFRASLFPAAGSTAVLWLMDWRALRKAKQQRL